MLDLGLTLLLKGELYFAQNRHIDASDYYDDAEDLLRENNGQQYLAKVYLAKAKFFLKFNEYKSAIFHLENALPVTNEYEGEFIRASILTTLGEVYFAQKNYNRSELILNESLKISESDQFPTLRVKAYEILSKIYGNQNDIEKAYAYQNAFYSLRDSINNIDKLKRDIREVEADASAYKDRLNADLQLQVEEQAKTLKNSKLTTILSSFLLIIISLLAISLYRNNQIKVKTNDLLLMKNVELETAKEEAIKAMQTKANFLSTVSHELRTPLYAVTGLTHLLLEENPK